MTPPTFAKLSLDGIHQRGADVRRMDLPYFGTNPFATDESIEDIDTWATKVAAWRAAWLEADRGRDAAMQLHLTEAPRFKWRPNFRSKTSTACPADQAR